MADVKELLGSGEWEVERYTVKRENAIGEIEHVPGSLFRVTHAREGVKEVVMFHEAADDDQRVSLMITFDDDSLDGQLFVNLSWRRDALDVCHFKLDDDSVIGEVPIPGLVLPSWFSYADVVAWAEAVERGEVTDSFFSRGYQATLTAKESPEP